jgi:hypothetical protein
MKMKYGSLEVILLAKDCELKKLSIINYQLSTISLPGTFRNLEFYQTYRVIEKYIHPGKNRLTKG